MRFSPLARVLDGFIPDALLRADPEELRRARLAVGVSLIGSAALLWAAVFQSFWGMPVIGLAAAAAAPLGLFLPFLLRLTGSLTLLTQALPLLQFTFAGLIVAGSGGQALWAFYWLALVPLTAVLLAGQRSAAIWAVLTVGAVAAVAWAVHLGAEFPLRPDPRAVPGSVFRGAVLATVVTLGVALILESLRQRAERELAEARIARAEEERRFRTLTEHASDVVIEWDARGRMLYMGPQVQEYTGLPADAFLGTRWRDHAERLHADDVPPFLAALRTSLRARAASEAAIRFRHADGSWRWIELKMRPFVSAEGDVRMVSVARDVTDRHEIEALRQLTKELEASIEQREQAESELARANRDLEDFTSVASHDLQEPLRKLVSFSALLREDLGGAPSADAERDLRFIEDGARRMQQLVRDLLALSRAGASSGKPERVVVDACVDRALEDLELRVQESGARIDRRPLPDLDADPTLLTGIYRNLVSNALKFAGDAPPQIRLTAEQRDGLWILGVADAGIGLAPDEQAEIFKPFRRLSAASGSEGSGIGLAFCRRAVERHGGRIWVESEPGRGSHFRFTLGAAGGAGEEELR